MTEALVVTGAGGALGSALVARLAQDPRTVVAVGRSVQQPALDARFGPGRVRAAAFDLGSPTEWKTLLDELARSEIAPTGAVLAAGGWRGGERLHESANDDVWRAMLDANLETVRVSLRALLPGMVARRRGSIAVIGSAAAARPWENARASAYAATKAAVTALVQATAAEVLADGVRINVVLPSTIDTEANRKSMPNADHGRWVAPESIADVVAFLLSDAARDISGAALPVYGRVTV